MINKESPNSIIEDANFPSDVLDADFVFPDGPANDLFIKELITNQEMAREFVHAMKYSGGLLLEQVRKSWGPQSMGVVLYLLDKTNAVDVGRVAGGMDSSTASVYMLAGIAGYVLQSNWEQLKERMEKYKVTAEIDK